MSFLSTLLRNSCFTPMHLCALRRGRPRVSAKTLRKRKEKKRLKYVNQYSADFTGEKPLHPWMDPRRVKALFLSYQEMRNTHRFTRNIDEKDQKEIVNTSKEYSSYYVSIQ